MRRLSIASLLMVALATGPASADPGIFVSYHDELLRVTLRGSYAGSYYQVWRSGELVGQYDPMLAQAALCTGDCFLTDLEVTPGRTYYYRFELQTPNGQRVSYGPYEVTIPDTPVGVRVTPNPSRGAVGVELSLPGSARRDVPLQADARVLDVQGRTVRVLHAGTLGRGITSLSWDGRSSSGQSLGAGTYFIRFTTPVGTSMARVVRFR